MQERLSKSNVILGNAKNLPFVFVNVRCFTFVTNDELQ